jgi:predicted nucleotidyltransferase
MLVHEVYTILGRPKAGMNIDPPNRAPGLALFFSSLGLARLVIFFWVHPKQRFHLRDLMRRTGRSMASIQDALERMVEIGALRREDVGGRACYVADEGHPSWRAWVLLLRASGSFAEILREALIDAEGIEAAFVFGSQARGDTRPDSDVDLFLIGSEEARDGVVRDLLLEAEFLLGKELDVIGSDAEKLAARVRSGSSFVNRSLPSRRCGFAVGRRCSIEPRRPLAPKPSIAR